MKKCLKVTIGRVVRGDFYRTSGFGTQLKLLLKRNIMQQVRNPLAARARFGQTVIVALL